MLNVYYSYKALLYGSDKYISLPTNGPDPEFSCADKESEDLDYKPHSDLDVSETESVKCMSGLDDGSEDILLTPLDIKKTKRMKSAEKDNKVKKTIKTDNVNIKKTKAITKNVKII